MSLLGLVRRLGQRRSKQRGGVLAAARRGQIAGLSCGETWSVTGARTIGARTAVGAVERPAPLIRLSATGPQRPPWRAAEQTLDTLYSETRSADSADGVGGQEDRAKGQCSGMRPEAPRERWTAIGAPMMAKSAGLLKAGGQPLNPAIFLTQPRSRGIHLLSAVAKSFRRDPA